MHASFEEIQEFIGRIDLKLIFSIRNPNVELKMLKKIKMKEREVILEKRKFDSTEIRIEKKQKITYEVSE